MKKAMAWIEEALYTECPYCGSSELMESDHSVDLPEEDDEWTCSKCKETFIVEGEK